MGIVSSFKNLFKAKAKTKNELLIQDGPITIQIIDLVRHLGPTDYITTDYQVNVLLVDDVTKFTKDVDLEEVFICGGYAAFLAGYTNAYNDLDFFCTSKFAFDTLASRLDVKDEKSPTVVEGHFNGHKINVVHRPQATCVEDILDVFDTTWCRVALDLKNQCIIEHPDADSEMPIFDKDRLIAINISKTLMTQRVFERYCKYKERRIKPCPIADSLVYQELARCVKNQEEAAPIPQKTFDDSY